MHSCHAFLHSCHVFWLKCIIDAPLATPALVGDCVEVSRPFQFDLPRNRYLRKPHRAEQHIQAEGPSAVHVEHYRKVRRVLMGLR
jgi:hypothetical protein